MSGIYVKVVLTFGVWDLLHIGHVRFLTAARALGDHLVVGVPTDEVVEKDKGCKPVIRFPERIEMVRSLHVVDDALSYDELGFLGLIEWTCPCVLAVGGDWGDEPRHRDAVAAVERRGGKVVRLPRTPGVSTSAIIKRIRGSGGCLAPRLEERRGVDHAAPAG